MAQAGELAAYLVKKSSIFPAYRNVVPALSFTLDRYIGHFDDPLTMSVNPLHYAYTQQLMVSFKNNSGLRSYIYSLEML